VTSAIAGKDAKEQYLNECASGAGRMLAATHNKTIITNFPNHEQAARLQSQLRRLGTPQGILFFEASILKACVIE